MPKWPNRRATYLPEERNGKWTVHEYNPDGNDEYLGEYDTKEEAKEHALIHTNTINSLNYSDTESEYVKMDEEKKRKEKKAATELVEKARKNTEFEVHRERLIHRASELNRQRDNLTRHQIRRQGRH